MDEEIDNIATEAKPEVINASCRGPVLFLFASSAVWLVQAALAGVLGSFKVHVPGFLADCSFLTYGHLQANAWVAFLFGFAGNAGLGLTLWMHRNTPGPVDAIGGAVDKIILFSEFLQGEKSQLASGTRPVTVKAEDKGVLLFWVVIFRNLNFVVPFFFSR